MNNKIRRATNQHRKQWLTRRTMTRRTRWLNYQRELMTSTMSWISDGEKWVRDPNDQTNQVHARYRAFQGGK